MSSQDPATPPGDRQDGSVGRRNQPSACSKSSYVKRLEARGHITREPNPDDRRSYRLRLTDAGRRAHQQAGERFRPVRSQVAVALADQKGGVRETLLQLRGVIDDLRRRSR